MRKNERLRSILHYFSPFEWSLLGCSVAVILTVSALSRATAPLSLVASLIGAIALVFLAKGNVAASLGDSKADPEHRVGLYELRGGLALLEAKPCIRARLCRERRCPDPALAACRTGRPGRARNGGLLSRLPCERSLRLFQLAKDGAGATGSRTDRFTGRAPAARRCKKSVISVKRRKKS